jgi:putative endonuclease
MPYYVYILTTFRNTVLYTGVTGDLLYRTYQHREKMVEGFTKRYNVWKLVYFEVGDDVMAAIEREKQIKAGSRADKIALIEKENPTWRDLWWEIQDA